jgi:hypothetical protein
MANPASWAVLGALGGAHFDSARGELWLAPSWPSAWGRQLESLPILLPGFAAALSAERTAASEWVDLRLTACGAPLRLRSVGVRLPHDFIKSLDKIIAAQDLELSTDERLQFSGMVTLAQPGDGFRITVRRTEQPNTLEATLELYHGS